MILINKGKEPKSLLEFRLSGGTDYESLPKNVKEDIVESLLLEQGHLCAYCMRRIPDTSEEGKKKTVTGVQIEHIAPRSLYPELQLDYHNMIAVCPGVTKDENHCDASREEKTELALNPLDLRLEQSISYKFLDGTIESSNPDWNSDLNGQDRLNLNHPSLKSYRKSSLDGMLEGYKKLKKDKNWNNEWLKRKLDAMLDSTLSIKDSYLGIKKYYIQKRINRN